MSTEKLATAEAIPEEIHAELQTLLKNGARLFGHVQGFYREHWPQDHRLFCAMVEQRGGQLYVRMTLTPAPSVELGVERAGERLPLFAWPVAQSCKAN